MVAPHVYKVLLLTCISGIGRPYASVDDAVTMVVCNLFLQNYVGATCTRRSQIPHERSHTKQHYCLRQTLPCVEVLLHPCRPANRRAVHNKRPMSFVTERSPLLAPCVSGAWDLRCDVVCLSAGFFTFLHAIFRLVMIFPSITRRISLTQRTRSLSHQTGRLLS